MQEKSTASVMLDGSRPPRQPSSLLPLSVQHTCCCFLSESLQANSIYQCGMLADGEFTKWSQQLLIVATERRKYTSARMSKRGFLCKACEIKWVIWLKKPIDIANSITPQIWLEPRCVGDWRESVGDTWRHILLEAFCRWNCSCAVEG